MTQRTDALGEAFDPAGAEWTTVSPALATMRRTIAVAVAVVIVLLTAGPAMFAGAPAFAGGALIVIAAVVALVWRLIGRGHRAWGYTERADDLLVRRGVAFRKLVVVPYGRMQFVDVSAGPLQRAFGLATVQLHTAAAATDARIPGLPPAEAARLRDRLAARGESRSAGL